MGLDALEDALKAHEIPYHVAGGRRYFARPEYENLVSVLLAVDNPLDGGSVLAALRSPFFGQSDEDLFRHVSRGGRLDYLADGARDDPDLADAFNLLRELHELGLE